VIGITSQQRGPFVEQPPHRVAAEWSTTNVTQEPQPQPQPQPLPQPQPQPPPQPQPQPVNPVASFMKLVDLVPSQLGETWWKLVEPTEFAAGALSENGNLITKFDDGGQVIYRIRLHNHEFDFASNSGWISISGDVTFTSFEYHFNREYRCTFYFADGNWKILKVEWGQVQNKPLNLVQMKATKRPELIHFFEELLEIAANSK